jgi:hypothetical protein
LAGKLVAIESPCNLRLYDATKFDRPRCIGYRMQAFRGILGGLGDNDQKAISNKPALISLFGFRIEVLRFFLDFRASDFEF